MHECNDDAPSFDAADLPDLNDIAGELYQLDDVPAFTPADSEVDTTLRLSGDRSFMHTPARRLFVDYRSNPDAYKHLEHLPAEGESLHGVISGKYALWDLVPGLIERTGQRIDHIHVATLSFSKANAADILGLLDDDQIKRFDLIISYYFKSTSRPIYDALVPQLLERGQRVRAIRNHCKMLLIKLVDGTRYVVESSANLRSSVNIEQFVMTRDAGLYDFHRDWQEREILHGVELGEGGKEKPTKAAR